MLADGLTGGLDHLADVGVDQAHGHRSFADGRGNALDRTTSNIAGGKDPGEAGLQEKRGAAGATPAVVAHDVGRETVAGYHEPLGVQLDAVAEPLGIGVGSDEQKQRAGVEPQLSFVGARAPTALR